MSTFILILVDIMVLEFQKKIKILSLVFILPEKPSLSLVTYLTNLTCVKKLILSIKKTTAATQYHQMRIVLPAVTKKV